VYRKLKEKLRVQSRESEMMLGQCWHSSCRCRDV